MSGGTVRIGVSGWKYGGWRRNFYPAGLRQRDELGYASRQFDTIEINGTFYSLQRPEFFGRWHDETPEGFVFAIKGSRFVTHMKRLGDVASPLANFFASGLLRLEEKLGPFLWQLSPRLRFDAERLERFFALLPRTTEEAAALARRHDQRVAGRSWTCARSSRPLRHAIEIRHASFCRAEFIALLRNRNIALAFADSPDWPYGEDVTADFVYIRLHGATALYASGYEDQALDHWARRIAAWAQGDVPERARWFAPALPPPHRVPRDVYVYFDNDAWAHAPFNARVLKARFGLVR
jgi:uncharacterized protein YecE (DUF72 family)